MMLRTLKNREMSKMYIKKEPWSDGGKGNARKLWYSGGVKGVGHILLKVKNNLNAIESCL